MELAKEKRKKIEFFNKVRTNLLICSNAENQNYLKNCKVLLNSASPINIIQKYEAFEVKFENPSIHTTIKLSSGNKASNIKDDKVLKELKSLNKSLENNNIFMFAEMIKKKKIICSRRKMQRLSGFLAEKSLVYEQDNSNFAVQNKEKSPFNSNGTTSNILLNISTANNINFVNFNSNNNNLGTNSNFNSSNNNNLNIWNNNTASLNNLHNSSLSVEKVGFNINNNNNAYEANNTLKRYSLTKHIVNSNSNILSKTFLLNHLPNKEEFLKSKKIQKAFDKLQKLAKTLKIIHNNASENAKENKIKYDELLDILEYKGLNVEKEILTENIEKNNKKVSYSADKMPQALSFKIQNIPKFTFLDEVQNEVCENQQNVNINANEGQVGDYFDNNKLDKRLINTINKVKHKKFTFDDSGEKTKQIFSSKAVKKHFDFNFNLAENYDNSNGNTNSNNNKEEENFINSYQNLVANSISINASINGNLKEKSVNEVNKENYSTNYNTKNILSAHNIDKAANGVNTSNLEKEKELKSPKKKSLIASANKPPKSIKVSNSIKNSENSNLSNSNSNTTQYTNFTSPKPFSPKQHNGNFNKFNENVFDLIPLNSDILAGKKNKKNKISSNTNEININNSKAVIINLNNNISNNNHLNNLNFETKNFEEDALELKSNYKENIILTSKEKKNLTQELEEHMKKLDILNLKIRENNISDNENTNHISNIEKSVVNKINNNGNIIEDYNSNNAHSNFENKATLKIPNASSNQIILINKCILEDSKENFDSYNIDQNNNINIPQNFNNNDYTDENFIQYMMMSNKINRDLECDFDTNNKFESKIFQQKQMKSSMQVDKQNNLNKNLAQRFQKKNKPIFINSMEYKKSQTLFTNSNNSNINSINTNNTLNFQQNKTNNNIHNPNVNANTSSKNTLKSYNNISNNTQSGFITNIEIKEFDNSNVTSNSILSNNLNDFNSNIYHKNSNNSNNGYSSVSFYEMNSELNAEEIDHNSNLLTCSNYISYKVVDVENYHSNKNHYNSDFNTELAFESNVYRDLGTNYNEDYESSNQNLNNQNQANKLKNKNENIRKESDSDYVSDISKHSYMTDKSKTQSYITKSSCSDLEI